MLPRDRVIAALSHEDTDRCPMQISFTPEFADRLRADLRIAAWLPGPARASTTRTAAATRTSSNWPSTRTSPHLGGLGELVLPGAERLHRRMGRDMARRSRTRLRSARATTPRWSAGPSPATRQSRRIALRIQTDRSSTRRPNASSGSRRRVLHRRRHGHHDLGDGLGAARLRADADRPGGGAGSRRGDPGDPVPLPSPARPSGCRRWAWT